MPGWLDFPEQLLGDETLYKTSKTHPLKYILNCYNYSVTWLTFTLLAVFAFAFYYVLSRAFLKQKGSDAISYAVLFNIVCGSLLLILSINKGFDFPDIKRYALNLALMGVLYTASQIFIFKATKTIEASELIILSSTRVLWTIGAAMLFLGESFGPSKIIGTALILFSVVYVSYSKQRVKFAKGHVYAILAGLCLGLGFVNDAYILQNSDAYSYAAIAFIVPAIITVLVFPSSIEKIKKLLDLKLLRNIGLLSIFYSVGITSSYLAYQHGGTASQIVPIGQSTVIVTVLLAALFIGERQHLIKKLIAAVLVSVGVLLLR